ncbi:MAG: DNA primase [Kiritimatiellia bacterium]|nr:DNA primase [Kiritimatiellia bacterium]
MKAVSQNIIDEIRARCDIVDIISPHVQLHKAGSSFKGLCPFHREKTPSFHVQPVRQSYHCFGCGKGGDVFRFVMDHENVDFPAALQILARRAGVELAFSESEKRDGSRKDRLYDLHEQAAALYARLLKDSPEAEAAREYLRSRDLDGKEVAPFRIGYAPARPDTLIAWAAKNQWPMELLVTGGLVYAGEGRSSRGPTDRFQNRLMFPIWDETGRVIGFSGRVLRKEDHPAKYVNSPETPLFHKSRILYALHLARRSIAEKKFALLCEGQIDVIRCHGAGLSNAIAAQGTAITEDHARILRRNTDDVVLLLDGDAAGEAAALRTAGILLAAGLQVRAVALPAGEDPDSFLLSQGAQALETRVQEAPDAVTFLLEGLSRRGELSDTTGVARATRAVIELAAQAPEAVTRELLLQKAAARLRIPEEVLRQDLRQSFRRSSHPRTEPQLPAGAESTGSASAGAVEQAILEHVFHYRTDSATRACAARYLPASLFQNAVHREFLKLVLEHAADPAWNPVQERPEDEAFSQCAARIALTPPKPMGADLPPEIALRSMILTIWRKEFDRRRKDIQLRKSTAGGSSPAPPEDEDAELALHLASLRRGWDAALPILELHVIG